MTNHGFTPKDPNYRAKVEDSFKRQAAMSLVGCSITEIEPGRVKLSFPYDEKLTQQDGFIHAGMLATVLDSACGYAAFSLMSEEAAVLSVEFKINLMSPAKGETFDIVGEVVRPGRTITVCRADAFAVAGGERKLVSQMTGTMMAVYEKTGIKN